MSLCIRHGANMPVIRIPTIIEEMICRRHDTERLQVPSGVYMSTGCKLLTLTWAPIVQMELKINNASPCCAILQKNMATMDGSFFRWHRKPHLLYTYYQIIRYLLFSIFPGIFSLLKTMVKRRRKHILLLLPTLSYLRCVYVVLVSQY